MERSKIVETCREVIYECVPDMEGTPLYEDTVINTDTAIDSMGFTMIICRLEARFDVKIPQSSTSGSTGGSDYEDIQTGFPDPLL